MISLYTGNMLLRLIFGVMKNGEDMCLRYLLAYRDPKG